jgi:hypothetical protein
MDATRRKLRTRRMDIVLLIGSSILVAAMGVGLFWLSDSLHVSPAWLFGIVTAFLFFLVVGWGYRSLFRSQAFIAFFATWTVVHVATLLLVLAYLGFSYYVPIVTLELWLGYAIAIWWFGPPPDKGIQYL